LAQGIFDLKYSPLAIVVVTLDEPLMGDQLSCQPHEPQIAEAFVLSPRDACDDAVDVGTFVDKSDQHVEGHDGLDKGEIAPVTCVLSTTVASITSLPPSAKHTCACTAGSKCKVRTMEHLTFAAHPFDEDYAQLCTNDGLEPETMSLWSLFDWVDVDESGKISKEELEAAFPLLKSLFAGRTGLGSGRLSFSEFAEWAGPRLGLPLGVTASLELSQKYIQSVRSAVLANGCLSPRGEPLTIHVVSLSGETKGPFEMLSTEGPTALLAQIGLDKGCQGRLHLDGTLLPIDDTFAPPWQDIVRNTLWRYNTKPGKSFGELGVPSKATLSLVVSPPGAQLQAAGFDPEKLMQDPDSSFGLIYDGIKLTQQFIVNHAPYRYKLAYARHKMRPKKGRLSNNRHWLIIDIVGDDEMMEYLPIRVLSILEKARDEGLMIESI
jgi:hypothetical protein